MSQNNALTIMFSAGEASGDQHAANMFLEISKIQPNIKAIGMGGKHMVQAGVDVRYDSTTIAVIGLFEIIRHLPEGRTVFKLMQQIIINEQPNLLVCVDYKEFNLRLARFAKRQGVKVLFYVSPQVWAWRPGRVKTYGQAIDMMAVIFPFETAWYEAERVPVRYVGHPSVDKIKPKFSKAENLQRFGLNGEHLVIGLLPGSRVNEIKRLMPVMLNAAARLKAKHPALQFILPQADTVSDVLLHSYLQENSLNIKVVKQEVYDVIECCDGVMTCSGTASLEVALLQIPMVITYKLSPLTYYLGRWLIKTKFIGLPNIVMGKAVIKELIQQAATAEALAAEMDKILFDLDYRQAMYVHLQQIKQQLGQGGGSKNMALLALEMLQD